MVDNCKKEKISIYNFIFLKFATALPLEISNTVKKCDFIVLNNTLWNPFIEIRYKIMSSADLHQTKFKITMK